MKEVIKRILSTQEAKGRELSVTREYLQARILQILQEERAFSNWVFCGGTALRFLFNLSRYSEDLDFALTKPGEKDLFVERIHQIKVAFEKEGYSVEAKAKINSNVKSAFITFQGLLYELGVSPFEDHKLSIKIEIDTNPPLGGKTSTTVVRHYIPVNLLHYDKASLLTGKIHALLNRAYTKGRDIFDLVWYLSDRTWPAPNIAFLNNALKQTGWSGETITEGNWRKVLLATLDKLNWDRAKTDVEPFLEQVGDAALVSHSVLKNLLDYKQ